MFFLSKALRLETGQKNSTHINYSNKFNNCAIDFLKKQLKENKREAVSMFEDQNFLKWLTKAVDYKPYSLKNLFVSKKIKHEKLKDQSQPSRDLWLFASKFNNLERFGKQFETHY